MAEAKMKAEIREETGKSKVRQLRNNDFIPAVVYGKGEETKTIKVNKQEFQKTIRSYGVSSLIDLELDGETVPVIIKEMQNDPIKGDYIHIDFQKLLMDELVKMTLPINIIGREKVNTHDTVFIQQLDEIEIECLPRYIPQVVEADVSNIDLKTPFFVEDLEIFKDENITVLRDPQDVVAILTEPTSHEEEEEEELDEMPEVEVIGETEKETEEE